MEMPVPAAPGLKVTIDHVFPAISKVLLGTFHPPTLVAVIGLVATTSTIVRHRSVHKFYTLLSPLYLSKPVTFESL